MSLKIRKHLVSSSVKSGVTFNGTNGRTHITIHETDNPGKGANADAHARLQAGGNSRNASWHWQVDDKEAVQSFKHTAQCWAAGSTAGNINSIHVEICVNSDGNYKKAVENAAELVRKIMKDEGISVMNVVQHNHWSGKNCPRNMRAGSKGINWSDFTAMLKGSGVSTTKPSKPQTSAKPYTKDAKYPKLENYGKNVLSVQKLLNKAGYKVDEDSSFGPSTDKALRQFQKDNGLAVDGQAGPATQKALKGSANKEDIKVDGSWGPATTRALQRYFGTTVDGVISGQPSNISTKNIPSAKFGTSGSNLIRAMQRHYKSGIVDGKISGTSNLIKAMQRKYGLKIVDGQVSLPSNLVKEIQRRLNNGTL